MKTPTCNICCYCFSARTGALILGWLSAIFGSIAFLIYTIDWFNFNESFQTLVQYYEDNATTPEQKEQANYLRDHKTLFVSILAFACIKLLFDTLSAIGLLFGVYKRRAGFIKQWLIIYFLENAVVVLIFTLVIILLMFGLSEFPFAALLPIIIGYAVGIGFTIHFWLVVATVHDTVTRGEPFEYEVNRYSKP